MDTNKVDNTKYEKNKYNTYNFVNTLFDGYEETESLKDFREELKSNLDDRISYLTDQGMSEKNAFSKATDELGDISVIADDISLRKKQEVFADMYMGTRKYMSTKRVLLFILCGIVFLFGIITSAIVWANDGTTSGVIGVQIVFGIIPIAGFVFLGLTQETRQNEPMSWKRALWYTLAVATLLFGIAIFVMLFFIDDAGLVAAIATLIPFVIPALALGAFLVLTEKDRSKPWVMAQREEILKAEHNRFSDPSYAKKYGVLSGAIWIFAIAVFILLTMTIGIKFSWITFLFAVGAQLLVEFFTTRVSRK